MQGGLGQATCSCCLSVAGPGKRVPFMVGGVIIQLTNRPALGILHVRRGNNSVVECQLPKLKVAGSNPVSRSKKIKGLGNQPNPFFLSYLVLHPFLHPFVMVKSEISCIILKPVATINGERVKKRMQKRMQ